MRKLSVFLVLVPGLILAVAPASNSLTPNLSQCRLLGEVSNEPAGGLLTWWTGGNATDFTVMNCLQTSYIERTSAYLGSYQYEQVSINDAMIGTGEVLEYPAGSRNYYNFSAGFWFGALWPKEIDGTDTTWFPSVSQGGPYSDLGAMAIPEMEDGGSLGNLEYYGLNFSNARIPEGMEGEGDRLFAPIDATPKSYQVLWPFADTMLNQYRAPGDELDPAQGDQVSHEDVYTVGGDWIPADQAVCLWIRDTVLPSGDTLGSYNVHGMGIRVEMRSYAWFQGPLEDAIVFNYKVRNMNDYPLKAPYFGFFMDNDIGGAGSPGVSGSWDDLIGYDDSRGIVYTYDNDGEEDGWSPPPGYLGVVYLNTPDDVGLSGFMAWENDTLSDDTLLYAYFDGYAVEEAQYDYMASAGFTPWDTPTDVRMLPCSGPYGDMEPDQEHDITMAIVMGDDLKDLQSNVDALTSAYYEGLPWVGIKESEPDPYHGLELDAESITHDVVTIRYSLPEASEVSVSVFDASGRRVTTLKQGYSPDSGDIIWDASGHPRGVYYLRLLASDKSCTQRVLLVR